MGLCVILQILPPLLFLCNLVPDPSVDPQGPGQGQAGSGAGDPAAQRAGDAADDTVRLAHFLEAACAEGVVAMEDPRDPVAAGVFAVAHCALELFVYEHGESDCKPASVKKDIT